MLSTIFITVAYHNNLAYKLAQMQWLLTNSKKLKQQIIKTNYKINYKKQITNTNYKLQKHIPLE
jgi:hypothetical protein